MAVAFIIVLLLGIALTNLYSYLLFHSLAELFSVIVASGTFVLAWNGRRFIQNGYLMVLGVAYGFVAALDLLHTLAYRGMGVFQGFDADLPTQLWVAARYVESLSLLVALTFLKRPVRPVVLFAVYLAVTIALGLSIFVWRVFPPCFIEGQGGLTPFKIGSEIVISTILVAAAVLTHRSKESLDTKVRRLLVGSIVVTIVAELCFTLYTGPYAAFNMVGHLLKIVSFYLVYKALIETGLRTPLELLFRDLRQSERELRHSEERHRTLVELSPDAIAVHDGEVYLYANPAAAELFCSESQADLVGRKVLDLVSPEDREKVTRRIRRSLLDQSGMPPIEVSLLSCDGRLVRAEVMAAPIVYEEREAVMVIMRDVTERRRLERQMVQMEKLAMMGQVAGGVAHEIRNPLGAINNAVYFLQMLGVGKSSEAREPLEIIQREIRNSERVISSLLDFAKGGAPECVPLDLNELVRHTVANLSLPDEVELILDLDAELPECSYDDAVTQRALDNLLNNAIDAMTEGGRLTISTAVSPGGQVSLSVSDTGVGMSAETLTQVFDPFYTTKAKGIGLGLAIVKREIERLGGSIECQSTEGEGTTFTIVFPSQDRPDPPGQSSH